MSIQFRNFDCSLFSLTSFQGQTPWNPNVIKNSILRLLQCRYAPKCCPYWSECSPLSPVLRAHSQLALKEQRHQKQATFLRKIINQIIQDLNIYTVTNSKSNLPIEFYILSAKPSQLPILVSIWLNIKQLQLSISLNLY